MAKVKLKKVLPAVAYCGSLIQQNHAETLDNHGWCLWDVPSRKFEFIKVDNDYGYVTVEVSNGKITYPENLPKNVRMRLFTCELDNTKVKKIITTLKKKCNIVELSINKNRFTKTSTTSNYEHDHETLNLTDVGVQQNLIFNWLSRNVPSVSSDVLTLIEKINKDLNNKIAHDDLFRNVHWRPLNFKFSNMFSYGENNEINFSDMHGVYGIFASNASGKSSIMDSLMFCLYDKTPRAFKGDHIINNRKDTFECELEFEINDETYVIKRNGKRKKNGDVKIDVNFWKILDNGNTLSLNGEDRRDTNANIRNYIGSYEDFVMTALSSQTSNALFIDKSHSERKDLLIQFMGLNIFDKLFDAANDDAKEIIGVLKRFKKSDVTDALSSTHTQLANTKQQLVDVEIDYEQLKEQRESLDNILISTQLLKRPVPETSGNRDQLKKDLNKVVSLLKKEEETHLQILKDRETILVEEQQLDAFLSTFDIFHLKKCVDLYQKCLDSLQKERNAVKILFAKIEEKSKFQTKLQSYKYNPDCAVCVENNKSVIQDILYVKKELEDLNSTLLERKEILSKLELEEDFLKPFVSDYEKVTKTQLKLEKVKQTLLSLKSKEDVAKLSIEKAKNQIATIEQEINVYTVNEEAIIHNQKIDNDIIQIQLKITEKKKIIQQLDQKIRSLHGTIGVLENKKQELLDKLKEAEQLEIMHEAYTHYLSVVGRDGVPYELMSKIIPKIESEINSILSQLVDFTISLEVDGKNINGKLTYDYDRSWPLENSSGMERFISSIAIRIALMNASNLPKANFFIADEGFGVLDSDHIGYMQTLFNILKTHFDFIFIVSHLDVMRDMVDHLIEIKKDDGYSHVSV